MTNELSIGQRIFRASDILLVMAQTLVSIPDDLSSAAVCDDFRIELDDNEVTVTGCFYTSAYYLKAGDHDEKDKAAAVMSHDRLVEYRRAIGGSWSKDYFGSLIRYEQEKEGVTIRLECSRGATCRRVVTGVREIPEERIPAKVIPARTEEQYEWECN
jgi:hypothetical protein